MTPPMSLSWAIAGGALIGLSATVVLVGERRTPGVSGFATRLLDGGDDRAFAAWFLAGLAVAGGLASLIAPAAFADASGRPGWLFALGGLLVGVGARLANGCTSGHGLAGVARGAPRSLVAIALFIVAAAMTLLLAPIAIAGATP